MTDDRMIKMKRKNKQYLYFLYLFTFTGIQQDFHIRWCSCCLSITRRVSHVEQEPLTLPEYMSSPPVFSSVLVARSVVVCVMFCRSLFFLLSVILLAIVLCHSMYGFWLPLCYLFLALKSIIQNANYRTARTPLNSEWESYVK